MKGTRITYSGGTPNPRKDNRDALKDFKDDKPLSEKEYKKMMKDPEMAFMHVTDDNVYGICKLWYKRFPFLMLEPNPVTFYYSVAFDICKQINDCHGKLSAILKEDIDPHSKSRKLSVAYSYVFKVTSIGIIFSFLAIEAFLNQELPNYEVKHGNKKVTKSKVERFYTFDQKLDIIIPEINGKNYGTSFPKRRAIIEELKNIRNELTHLKKKEGSGVTNYEELYQKVLNVDLVKIVRTVKNLINFYYPRLIVNYTYNPMANKR